MVQGISYAIEQQTSNGAFRCIRIASEGLAIFIRVIESHAAECEYAHASKEEESGCDVWKGSEQPWYGVADAECGDDEKSDQNKCMF